MKFFLTSLPDLCLPVVGLTILLSGVSGGQPDRVSPGVALNPAAVSISAPRMVEDTRLESVL